MNAAARTKNTLNIRHRKKSSRALSRAPLLFIARRQAVFAFFLSPCPKYPLDHICIFAADDPEIFLQPRRAEPGIGSFQKVGEPVTVIVKSFCRQLPLWLFMRYTEQWICRPMSSRIRYSCLCNLLHLFIAPPAEISFLL